MIWVHFISHVQLYALVKSSFVCKVNHMEVVAGATNLCVCWYNNVQILEDYKVLFWTIFFWLISVRKEPRSFFFLAAVATFYWLAHL